MIWAIMRASKYPKRQPVHGLENFEGLKSPKPYTGQRLGYFSGSKRASKVPKPCAGCRLVYVTLKYHARCHFRESSCGNTMPVDVSELSRGPFWRRPGGSGSQKCRRCDENTPKLVKSVELSAILTFRRQIGPTDCRASLLRPRLSRRAAS